MIHTIDVDQKSHLGLDLINILIWIKNIFYLNVDPDIDVNKTSCIDKIHIFILKKNHIPRFG